MKIVFWGGLAPHTGNTANMLAVALASALQNQYKTLLMQCKYSLYHMEDALSVRKQQSRIREEFSYFHNMGMDYLIQKSKMCELDEETIMKTSVPVFRDRAYYIPSSEKNNKDIYEKNLLYHIKNILSMSDRFADITYIDAGNSSGELTEKLFSEADLIVVTLPQNPVILNQFFSTRQVFGEKMIYLLGNYDYNSNYNLKNIRRIYRIEKERMGVVPYNVYFQNAFYKGELIKFLKNNLNCSVYHGNYFFIKEVLKTTKMILLAAGLTA